MNLKVLTLANKRNEQLDLLQKSCIQQGIMLDIAGEGHSWPRNAFKLRILDQHLSAHLHGEDIVMVVDAFDVFVNAEAEEILAKYQSFAADIVFSAEANYYFRSKELSLEYWINYPRHPDYCYHFLNSGTFIGKVAAIRTMLSEISDRYQIDYRDDDQLIGLRSDQYIYSRYYVDNALEAASKLRVMLDHQQELFGCSGGRMAVKSWPVSNEVQDYLFFKYERRMLKTFGLKSAQQFTRDISYSQGAKRFYNNHSGTHPAVIHLPGTYQNFPTILGQVMDGKRVVKATYFVSLIISFIAYVRSIFNSYYIIRRVGQASVSAIFPNAVFDRTTVRKYASGDISKKYPEDNPFWFEINKS